MTRHTTTGQMLEGAGRIRRWALGPLLGVLLTMAACDSGPSGPGEFAGSLEASGVALGGVVMEVSGPGIESFSGSGGTRVLWAATNEENVFRVVAINETPGPIQFKVSVQDVGADKPRATIASLVDGANLTLSLNQGYEVVFSR